MSPLMQNVLVGVAGIIATIAVIIAVATRFKLFKLKAGVQEDLANMYTPEVLGVHTEKKEVNKDGQEKVEKSKADDETANNHD